MEQRKLDAAIADVYLAFAAVPKPDEISGCQHCLPAHEANTLLSTPLREITEGQISSYAADVFLTVGESGDFLFFWPRILELSVKGRFLWPDPEVVLGKLRLANWRSWDNDLKLTVQALIDLKFGLVLEQGDVDEIDSWLCGIGRSHDDVQPYLGQLVDVSSRDALLGFALINVSFYEKGKLTNAFWDDAPATAQQVIAWMNSDATRTLLTEEYGMRFEP